mmetsp:Transcript_2291/g.7485  ORF Transcript_2291/g.7485 Transcript_2291/m.7485 type:complete len:210 (-) Transcript_2291:396-1025(-)
MAAGEMADVEGRGGAAGGQRRQRRLGAGQRVRRVHFERRDDCDRACGGQHVQQRLAAAREFGKQPGAGDEVSVEQKDKLGWGCVQSQVAQRVDRVQARVLLCRSGRSIRGRRALVQQGDGELGGQVQAQPAQLNLEACFHLRGRVGASDSVDVDGGRHGSAPRLDGGGEARQAVGRALGDQRDGRGGRGAGGGSQPARGGDVWQRHHPA